MKQKQILGIVLGIIVIGILVYVFYPATVVNYEADEESASGLQVTTSYMDVDATEAKELIDLEPELIVIDVSPHWANGHLPRAVSYYPLSTLTDAISSGELDSNEKYLIYCHADGPSRSGAQALIDAGFTNVYRLESHFGGWQSAGYPIEQ